MTLNASQHNATRCNAAQHVASRFNASQHTTATCCNTLQHAAPHSTDHVANPPQSLPFWRRYVATSLIVLQHVVRRCNALYRVASLFRRSYVAGVTNPLFHSKPEWWDLLCDADTGRAYADTAAAVGCGMPCRTYTVIS